MTGTGTRPVLVPVSSFTVPSIIIREMLFRTSGFHLFGTSAKMNEITIWTRVFVQTSPPLPAHILFTPCYRPPAARGGPMYIQTC